MGDASISVRTHRTDLVARAAVEPVEVSRDHVLPADALARVDHVFGLIYTVESCPHSAAQSVITQKNIVARATFTSTCATSELWSRIANANSTEAGPDCKHQTGTPPSAMGFHASHLICGPTVRMACEGAKACRMDASCKSHPANLQ